MHELSARRPQCNDWVTSGQYVIVPVSAPPPTCGWVRTANMRVAPPVASRNSPVPPVTVSVSVSRDIFGLAVGQYVLKVVDKKIELLLFSVVTTHFSELSPQPFDSVGSTVPCSESVTLPKPGEYPTPSALKVVAVAQDTGHE